jgi:ribosome-binding protein aMBF1 (putative translation factor)
VDLVEVVFTALKVEESNLDKAQSSQPGSSLHARKRNTNAGREDSRVSSDVARGLSHQDPVLQDKDGISGIDLRFILAECAQMRKQAGLTQGEVARRMGTTASAVARMESYAPGKTFSPKLETLQRYAQALGFRLVVKLERQENQLRT